MRDVKPVIDPLLALLRSRKFLTAAVALIVSILVAHAPELEAVRGELYTLLLVFALAVIGGTTIEDAAQKARETPDPQKPPREAARDVADAALDKLLGDENE